MVNLLKDLREIESRRGPLRGELNDWSGREKEYEETHLRDERQRNPSWKKWRKK